MDFFSVNPYFYYADEVASNRISVGLKRVNREINPSERATSNRISVGLKQEKAGDLGEVQFLLIGSVWD